MTNTEIVFSDADREQLLAFVYKEYHRNMARPLGNNLAGWWSIARGIGDFLLPFSSRRYFNLQFESHWHVICEDEDGSPDIEVKRWTVWAYNYDIRKSDPFATDPDSKTLLFKDMLMSEKDVEYAYITRQMEEDEEWA